MPWLRDPVPAADDRLDQRRLPEFPPQPQDGDRDGVGERICVLVPHLLQELLGRCTAAPSAETSTSSTPSSFRARGTGGRPW